MVAFWYNVTAMQGILTKYLVGAAVCWAVWGCGFHAFASDAADVVTDLQQSILTIMKDGNALGYTGRYNAISPTIDKTHDFDTIARLVVGRHWTGLTADQRSTFVETFRNLSIAVYAGQFKDYDGEQFNVVSEKPLKRGNRKLVITHFVTSDGKIVHFHYILHQVKNEWKIISVTVDGVSELALKRAEYGGILKKVGFPTLIEHLHNQIRENADGL